MGGGGGGGGLEYEKTEKVRTYFRGEKNRHAINRKGQRHEERAKSVLRKKEREYPLPLKR